MLNLNVETMKKYFMSFVCKDDVLTLLCHLGYLSYNNETKCACIPNYEVRQEFETAIADTSWREVTIEIVKKKDNNIETTHE